MDRRSKHSGPELVVMWLSLRDLPAAIKWLQQMLPPTGKLAS